MRPQQSDRGQGDVAATEPLEDDGKSSDGACCFDAGVRGVL
jgi:hypothetical protein